MAAPFTASPDIFLATIPHLSNAAAITPRGHQLWWLARRRREDMPYISAIMRLTRIVSAWWCINVYRHMRHYFLKWSAISVSDKEICFIRISAMRPALKWEKYDISWCRQPYRAPAACHVKCCRDAQSSYALYCFISRIMIFLLRLYYILPYLHRLQNDKDMISPYASPPRATPAPKEWFLRYHFW